MPGHARPRPSRRDLPDLCGAGGAASRESRARPSRRRFVAPDRGGTGDQAADKKQRVIAEIPNNLGTWKMYDGGWGTLGRPRLMRRVASVGGWCTVFGPRAYVGQIPGVVVPVDRPSAQGVLAVQAFARQQRFPTFDMSSVMPRGRLLDALRHSACSEANVRFVSAVRWACCG